MIKLNRTTEYGLIALRHMNQKRKNEGATSVTSAREIAESYGLPFEITAKTLQRLKDTGMIQSAQGARGGYTLQCSLSQTSLAEFLKLMEGGQSVVSCTSESSKTSCECEYEQKCGLRPVMASLNDRVHTFLSGIFLSELTEETKTQKYGLPFTYTTESALEP
jgi:Rrf2 family protein